MNAASVNTGGGGLGKKDKDVSTQETNYLISSDYQVHRISANFWLGLLLPDPVEIRSGIMGSFFRVTLKLGERFRVMLSELL